MVEKDSSPTPLPPHISICTLDTRTIVATAIKQRLHTFKFRFLFIFVYFYLSLTECKGKDYVTKRTITFVKNAVSANKSQNEHRESLSLQQKFPLTQCSPYRKDWADGNINCQTMRQCHPQRRTGKQRHCHLYRNTGAGILY